MFFQFSRFWQNYGFTSQLDTLLEKKDVTLEQILEEDNILVELKNSGATKFAKFITKDPRNYEKMIDYIINFKEEREDTKTQIKYPFMISEILSAENQVLIDFLFEKPANEEQKVQEQEEERVATEEEKDDREDVDANEESTKENDIETEQVKPDSFRQKKEESEHEQIRSSLLNKLFSFLDQDFLNVTSAGYFNKTIIPIIKKRGYDVWNHLNENPNILSNLVKHIDIPHISDVLEKLIILDTQAEIYDDTYIEQRQNLLKRLFNVILMKSHQTHIVDNVASLLVEVVQKGSNTQFFNNRDLSSLIDIINKPKRIFDFGVQTQSSSVLQIIVQLLDYIKLRGTQSKDKTSVKDDEMINCEDDDIEVPNYTNFYEICKVIPQALKSQNLMTCQFVSTYGHNTIPVTAAKLTILQIIYTLLQTNDTIIIANIAETECFTILQTMLLQHQFNNQIQVHFEKLITLIFDAEIYFPLQTQLINGGLIEFLINKNNNKPTNAGTMKNAVKPGYQGVLTKISNYLSKIWSSNSALSAIKQVDLWNTYLNTTLKEINEVESPWLCGVNPKSRNNQEDDIYQTTEQDVASILRRFQQHKPEEVQNQNEEEPSPEEEVDDDTNKEEEFQDVQDHDLHHDGETRERKESNSSSEEELIQDKINEVIYSPTSGPQEMSDLIEVQEKLELDDQIPPQEIENKSDAEVIQYWKHREQEEPTVSEKVHSGPSSEEKPQHIHAAVIEEEHKQQDKPLVIKEEIVVETQIVPNTKQLEETTTPIDEEH